MKVIVTGGAGYIGSHACKALANAGHEPVVFDNLRTGHRRAVKWGELVHGDINNPLSILNAMDAHRPDAVLHFAALAYVHESVINPGMYYRTNVSGTLALLNAMVSCEVDRLVFSSTCATYGAPDVLPIRENTGQSPINPYGRSKLMAEGIIADYCVRHGLGAMFLRYFNAAGADPEGELGEDHEPEPHLIPNVLKVAMGRSSYLTVNGRDFPTPDGTCVRDYIHVSDLASAHVLALDAVALGGSRALNLGTGLGHSVQQVITMVEKVTDRKVAVTEGPRRAGDPAVLVADASLAREMLGWRPNNSDLETIIRSAWHWMEVTPHASAGK